MSQSPSTLEDFIAKLEEHLVSFHEVDYDLIQRTKSEKGSDENKWVEILQKSHAFHHSIREGDDEVD